MTLREWLLVAAVLAGLLVGLPLLKRLCTTLGASAEVSRKSVHVGMGMACAAFPWIFERPLPVWVLAALATVPLLLLRLVPSLRSGIGSMLHGVQRPSYGEVLFAPAVALVFQLSQGRPLLHVIPISILTVADAAGALAGTQWGRRRYICGTGQKSVEGSAAFLGVAFLCGFVPLALQQPSHPWHAAGVALILAIVAMMAEGISDRGFDNLVIPVGCHFLLGRLLASDVPPLTVRLIAATLMLALVATGSRWSSLTGSALIGAALLGYGCAVLGDWRFLLPPLAIFLCHLFTTRRHGLKNVFDHRIDTVISHAIAALPWALAVDRHWLAPPVALAGLSAAMAVQLALLDAATQAHIHPHVRLTRATIKAWLIAGLPGLVWLTPQIRTFYPALTISIFLTPGLCYIFGKLDPRHETTPASLWMLKGVASLLAAAPVLIAV